MSHNNASKGLHVDRTFSTIKLLGGYDLDDPREYPDLYIRGGAKIVGDLNACSNVFIGEELTVDGNVTAGNVIATTFVGNLRGNIVSDTWIFGNVELNCNNVDNINRLTVANIEGKSGNVLTIEGMSFDSQQISNVNLLVAQTGNITEVNSSNVVATTSVTTPCIITDKVRSDSGNLLIESNVATVNVSELDVNSSNINVSSTNVNVNTTNVNVNSSSNVNVNATTVTVDADTVFIDADVLPTPTSSHRLGDNQHKWSEIYVDRITVCDELVANGIFNMTIVDGNLVEANYFCATTGVKTNLITPYTGTTITFGNITDTVDFKKADLININNLDACNIDVYQNLNVQNFTATGNVVLTGNVTAIDTTVANLLCATTILVETVTAKTGNIKVTSDIHSTANVVLDGDLCVNNVLYTGNLAGKSPINVLDILQCTSNVNVEGNLCVFQQTFLKGNLDMGLQRITNIGKLDIQKITGVVSINPGITDYNSFDETTAGTDSVGVSVSIHQAWVQLQTMINLTSIQVGIIRASTGIGLTASLYDGNGTGGTLLATIMPPSTTLTDVVLDFSMFNIELTGGSTYTIGLTDTSGGIQWNNITSRPGDLLNSMSNPAPYKVKVVGEIEVLEPILSCHDIDMTCNDLANVGGLYVGNIYAKDGNTITFKNDVVHEGEVTIGNVLITHDTILIGNTEIAGSGNINNGNVTITMNTIMVGDTLITGNAVCTGEIKATSNVNVSDSLNVTNNINTNNLNVSNDVNVTNDITIGGNACANKVITDYLESKGLDVGTLTDVIAIQSPAIVEFSTTGGGVKNQFWGYKSGVAVTSGDNNTALGHNSLNAVTSGSYNTAIGSDVLKSLQTGSYNTILGTKICEDTTSSEYNTFLGHYVFPYATNAGSENVAIGYYIGYQSGARAKGSVIIGHGAAGFADGYIGEEQVILGKNAGKYQGYGSVTGGGQNIMIGYAAMYQGTTGSNNIAIGSEALGGDIGDVKNAYEQIAIGNLAGKENDGNSLIAIGAVAAHGGGVQPARPNNTIAIGKYALENIETGGDNNTSLGHFAGQNTTTGSQNTFVGYKAIATSGVDGSVVIGAKSYSTASNAIVIGYGAYSNSQDSVSLGSQNPTNNSATAEVWGQVFQNRAWNGGVREIATITATGDIEKGGTLDEICANVLKTDTIEAKYSLITLGNTINMNNNDIMNVKNLGVDNIYGVVTPVNIRVDVDAWCKEIGNVGALEVGNIISKNDEINVQGNVCVNDTLLTDNISAKTGTISLQGDVCVNDTLQTDNISAKNTTVTFNNDIDMDENHITNTRKLSMTPLDVSAPTVVLTVNPGPVAVYDTLIYQPFTLTSTTLVTGIQVTAAQSISKTWQIRDGTGPYGNIRDSVVASTVAFGTATLPFNVELPAGTYSLTFSDATMNPSTAPQIGGLNPGSVQGGTGGNTQKYFTLTILGSVITASCIDMAGGSIENADRIEADCITANTIQFPICFQTQCLDLPLDIMETVLVETGAGGGGSPITSTDLNQSFTLSSESLVTRIDTNTNAGSTNLPLTATIYEGVGTGGTIVIQLTGLSRSLSPSALGAFWYGIYFEDLVLPAGTYTLRLQGSPNVLWFQNGQYKMVVNGVSPPEVPTEDKTFKFNDVYSTGGLYGKGYIECETIVGGITTTNVNLSFDCGSNDDNTLTVSNVCANTIITDVIEPKSDGNVRLTGNLDIIGNHQIRFTNDIEIGNVTTNAANGGIAIGKGSVSSSANSLAFGRDARSLNGSGKIAIGYKSRTVSAGGADQIAIGLSSTAYGNRSIAIGPNSDTASQYSIAIGVGALAQGFPKHQIAMGFNARCDGEASVAIGKNTFITNVVGNSIVLGPDTTSNFSRTVTIGHLQAASAVDEIKIGSSLPTNATATATTWDGQIFQNRAWNGGYKEVATISASGDIEKGGILSNICVETIVTDVIEAKNDSNITLSASEVNVTNDLIVGGSITAEQFTADCINGPFGSPVEEFVDIEALIPTSGTMIIAGITATSDNNLIVSGTFSGSTTIGGLPLSPGSAGSDVFIAKMTTSGVGIWVQRVNATNNGCGISAHTIDDNDNVYVLLDPFSSSATINPTGIGSTVITNRAPTVGKLDNAGNWQWITSATVAGSTNAWSPARHGIAVNNDGTEIFICGTIIDAAATITFAGAISSYGGRDIGIAKLNGSGVWQTQLNCGSTTAGSPGMNDGGEAIIVDNAGDVLVTGTYTGTDAQFGGIGPLPSGNNFFLAKFNNFLIAQWVQNIPTTGSATASSNSSLYTVGHDDSDNYYVAGAFDSSITFPGQPTLVSSGNSDLCVGKFNSAGVCQWSVKSVGGGILQNDGLSSSIYTSGDGTNYISFVSDDPNLITLGGLSTSGTGSGRHCIASFDTNGNFTWFTHGGALAFMKGITVDQDGYVYAGSTFLGSTTYSPLPTVSYGSFASIFVKTQPPNLSFPLVVKSGLDLLCNNLGNVQTLEVDELDAKNGGTDINIIAERLTFENTVQIGTNTSSGGLRGVAIGYGAETYDNYGVSIGDRAYAYGAGSIGIGYFAQAYGGFKNIAIGYNSGSQGNYSVTVGSYASTSSDYSVALGYLSGTSSSAINAIAIGPRTTTGIPNSVQIGQDILGYGQPNTVRSIAIGYNCQVGQNLPSQINADDSIILGSYAKALGANAIVIGFNTSTTVDESIALGRNALVNSTSRALALGIHSDSVITTGEVVPYLQCAVNGTPREIPLAVINDTSNVTVNSICANIMKTLFPMDIMNKFDDPVIVNGLVTSTGFLNILGSRTNPWQSFILTNDILLTNIRPYQNRSSLTSVRIYEGIGTGGTLIDDKPVTTNVSVIRQNYTYPSLFLAAGTYTFQSVGTTAWYRQDGYMVGEQPQSSEGTTVAFEMQIFGDILDEPKYGFTFNTINTSGGLFGNGNICVTLNYNDGISPPIQSNVSIPLIDKNASQITFEKDVNMGNLCVNNVLYTGNLAGKSPINVLDILQCTANVNVEANLYVDVNTTLNGNLCVNEYSKLGTTANLTLLTGGLASDPTGPVWDIYPAPATLANAVGWGTPVGSGSKGRWVLLLDGAGSTSYYSDDGGITWNTGTDNNEEWRHVTWVQAYNGGNGLYVASGFGNATGPVLQTSPDGITWTGRGVMNLVAANKTAYSPSLNRIVAVADDQQLFSVRVAYSNDGINWNAGAGGGLFGSITGSVSTDSFCFVAWSPSLGIFAAVNKNPIGSTRGIMTSSDGINWAVVTTPAISNGYSDIEWSETLGMFLAVSQFQTLTSTDGVTWIIGPGPAGRYIYRLIWSETEQLFAGACAGAGTNNVITSPDGVTWTSHITQTVGFNMSTIAYSENERKFLATGINASAEVAISPLSATTNTAIFKDIGAKCDGNFDEIIFINKNRTFMAERTTTTTDALDIFYAIPNSGNYAHFDVFVTAKVDASTVAAYSFRDGFVINKSGSLTLVSPTVLTLIEDNASLDSAVSVSGTNLVVTLTGIAGTVNWDVIVKLYTNDL